ncbi:MAG: FGGY-family carbohydrate kinase, partial [Candidatus Aphodomorpha sp.]
TSDVLRAMQEDSGIRLSALRVDGGASANNFLMQFQSDIIGAPVLRPACVETTAMGAAYLAGLAAGFWPSAEALKDNLLAPTVFEPGMSPAERSERLYGWEKAVRCSFGWAHA